jgi:site-specific DNA-methyltransferase (adenine-specific)
VQAALIEDRITVTAENRHLAYLLGEDIGIQLHRGDCLDVMATLEPGSVDLVLTDPPYGTTACKWDSVIPFEPMWERIHRVAKQNAAIVMTASQPFTSALVMSNAKEFKYCWVWNKRFASNYPQAKYAPQKIHEDLVVFCKSKAKYYPVMEKRDKPIVKGANKGARVFGDTGLDREDYQGKVYTHKYPESIMYFSSRSEKRGMHPTQKPVALMEYLIRTYTDEGDTVLDFTMGSGTTGIACLNTNRRFIGIELDETYFNIAEKRILTHQTA